MATKLSAELTGIQRFTDVGEENGKMLAPLSGYENKPLVPLAEAVEEIKTLVHGLDRMVWFATQHSSTPVDDVTNQESAAIRLYTMEGIKRHENFYYHFNQALRAEDRKAIVPWFLYLKLILTALYKLPSLKKPVWRGVRGDISYQYVRNHDYIWWGFSSCTSTVESLERHIGSSGLRTVFMIECINGKGVGNHSCVKDSDEILLLPGTFLRVIDNLKMGQDLHLVRLKEETPPYPLLASPFASPSPTFSNVNQLSDRLPRAKPGDLESTIPVVTEHVAKRTANERFLDAAEEPTQYRRPIEGYEKKPLVSLEKAVERIKTLVGDLDRKVWLAMRYSSTPTDSLTIDESAAIRLYTMQWSEKDQSIYTQLNQTLRAELRDNLRPWFSYLKLILTALYKLSSIKKTVWRGICGDVSSQYKDDYIWWGFSSCSTDKKVVEQFIGDSGARTIFEIECIHGKSIQNHSVFPNEKEILLLPGTYLSVKRKSCTADKLCIIHLQEVTAPHQLIAPPFDPSLTADETLPSKQPTMTTITNKAKKNSVFHQQEKNDEIKTLILPAPEDHILPKDISIVQPPDLSLSKETLDKVIGSIVGLGVGDALGVSVEFHPRQYLLQNPVFDIQGGGKLRLKAGQWADKTSMALCLASSLIIKKGFDPYNQMVHYKWWYKHGFLSSTGKCLNIGDSTRQSLDEFCHRQNQLKGECHLDTEQEIDQLNFEFVQNVNDFDVNCSSPNAAGNGALMRLAPIPLFYFRSPSIAIEYAARSATLTHGDQKAVDACRFYAALIVAAIIGTSKKELLSKKFYAKHRDWFGCTELHPEVRTVAEGSYKRQGGYDDGIRGNGYVVQSLEAALWAFWSDEDSFQTGALAAVNLGDDAGATAAIYGQLAGAYYGCRSIPKNWREKLYACDFLVCVGRWLHFSAND